jgi:hypothetical protein
VRVHPPLSIRGAGEAVLSVCSQTASFGGANKRLSLASWFASCYLVFDLGSLAGGAVVTLAANLPTHVSVDMECGPLREATVA